MKENVFNLSIEEYPVGKAVTDFVEFPSFYGLQKVQAPLYIYRATKEVSPCVVVTACVHGDEISGLNVAQTLMRSNLKLLKGTLIILPVVNIYGFLNKVRYLPDRKDLNRCFPGSDKGSFGSRFAHFIFENITKYGDIFIDLHSGAIGRYNVPQIRCDLSQTCIQDLVEQLSVPVVVNSSLRDGSLRAAINELKKPSIVFEGGEGLRITDSITKYGLNLVKSILKSKKMISTKKVYNTDKITIHKTKWIRAAEGGILKNRLEAGKIIKKGEVIGELRELSGKLILKIKMPEEGMILGINRTAMIMTGDALYNVGYFSEDFTNDADDLTDYFDFDL